MNVQNHDIHLSAIRKALNHGNAAVMVGSGFSRNARNGEQLATWQEMSGELWSALNPGEPPLNAFSTSIVTQLGEQYASVFSKPALEELLKRLVPDERVHPGDLHTQLLELPWVEIFTTNYDTLLERAAEEIVGRAHYTIACREDIPQSKILNRRRIVKLHGSFPSQRPFIFTEEEYRRYPENFAPFVNLVRQSLLENVFCLVGFSGDDPNFLHWIGWVRDMLDQHALPIYLILHKSPSLGQQKLLEARQVTPIILPLPPDADPENYSARLASFFRMIDPSQEPSDSDWPVTVGSHLSHRNISEDIEERKAEIVTAYQAVAALRKTYPGWLIAPRQVRQRLKYRVEYSAAFSDREALVNVLQDEVYVAAIIMANYAWYLDVALQSMDDQLAGEAQRILFESANPTAQSIKQKASTLKPFNVTSLKEYRNCWIILALGLLRWAREGLHREIFEEIQKLLMSVCDEEQVKDEIAYQNALFALYEGDRAAALHLLNNWEVASADGYMIVRKGSLLSELGENERGFTVSLSGLQQLRRDQRSRSDTVRYLSEEAWACTVIHCQQLAMTSTLRKRSEDGDQIAAKLSKRLVDLAAKGADVRHELELLEAALEAEAATPSEPKSVVPAFDLGKYTSSTTLGAPRRLSEKLDAAFSWLTLADRVALPPRIGNTNFNINSFLCSGWWVQYADSMQRVLSVLIRTMSISALNHPKPSDLRYATGWLSRFQVGKTDELLAIRICETSLSLIEKILGGELNNDAEQTLSFHVQVLGRLVLRVSDIDRVESYAKRIVLMHHRSAFDTHCRIWRHFAIALARCFEALPPLRQREMLPDIWDIARKPVDAHSHFLMDWVPLHLFNPKLSPCAELNTSSPRAIDTDGLLQTLEKSTPEDLLVRPENTRIWQYLYVLKNWDVLGGPEKERIRCLLWRHRRSWPVVAGFYPEATYAWGRPSCVDHHQALRKWILERLAPNFPSGGSMISTPKDGRRAWGFPVDNQALQALEKSFNEEPWPLTDAREAVVKIKSWWQHDGSDILHDLERVEELKTALLDRLDFIDVFLASVASVDSLVTVLDAPEIKQWLEEMLAKSTPCGASFKRFRIARATVSDNTAELWSIARELVEDFGDPNISITGQSAPRVVTYWLGNCSAAGTPAFLFLVRSMAAFIAARRMPALPWVLQLMANVVTHRPEILDNQALELTEIGLSKMRDELLYHARKEGSGIPDDNVPVIRFNCARLALAIREGFQRTSKATEAWVTAATNDPLPEMRFLTLHAPS